MRILKAHNQYRCNRKDQIRKAVEVFEMKNRCADISDEWFEHYDALMIEADIIQMFGKTILAHKKCYNPLTWIGLSEWFFKLIGKPKLGWSGRFRGTLPDYVKRASEAGIKYVMIEAKTDQKELVYAVDDMTLLYPKIVFVVMNKYWSYSEFVMNFGNSHTLPYCRTIISADEFSADNEIISVNLY